MSAKTEADKIVAADMRRAYAEGFKAFGRHFGHVAAALTLGFIQGLFTAWVLWVFWFAAVETWTFLASPAFIAGAELVAIAGLVWIWRLFHPKVDAKGE